MTRQEKRKAASAEWWKKNGAAYRAQNRERLRVLHANYRAKHKDIVIERGRAWRNNNPERQKGHERKYRTTHPERRKKSVDQHRARPEVKERERVRRREWVRRNKDRLAAKSAARRAGKLQATPVWANLSAIRAVYAEARRLTIETGIPHHVDHIYPLKSDWCCGLHVEANLQILTGVKNLSKGNRPIIEGFS